MTSVTLWAQQYRQRKLRLKRRVFRRLQKTGNDCADVTWCGRLLQTREAATGKAQSPYVDSRVQCTTRDGDEAERRWCRASRSWVATVSTSVSCGEGILQCEQCTGWAAKQVPPYRPRGSGKDINYGENRIIAQLISNTPNYYNFIHSSDINNSINGADKRWEKIKKDNSTSQEI